MATHFSRITAALAGSAMIALGAASMAPAFAQEATNTTTSPTAEASGGSELPPYVIQDVTLSILNGNKVEQENATIDDVKKISNALTVQGNYKVKIPDSAKAGDYFTVEFYNGPDSNWQKNVRNIAPEGEDEDIVSIESEDGTTYKVELLKEACGVEFSFTLNSEIDGQSEDPNNFTYTDATPAPEGFEWTSAECSDSSSENVEPQPSDTSSPSTSSPIITSTAPEPGNTSGTAGEPGEPGEPGGSGSAGGTGNADSASTDAGAADSAPVAPVTSRDSQTVVSGGGFTDDAAMKKPQWTRSDGGESISVEDDEATGPEVNTGGRVDGLSFFEKVVNSLR